MTLKEKFTNAIVLPFEYEKKVKESLVIADEFAIEFAEWILLQDITQRGKNNFVCADGVQRSKKELLEIFKKEKGL